MSGIPIFTSSPINAGSKKPSAVTPQTALPVSRDSPPSRASNPATATASTTLTSTASSSCPPPQPGTASPAQNKSSESCPPPQQTSANTAMPQPYPPQMSIPPPTTAFGQPHSVTSTSNASSSSYPVPLPSQDDGRHSFEHPPGYHQNINASELTSEQRRAIEASNTSRDSSERMSGEEGEGVWNSLGKMAQQAGAKISEAEAGIWRSINAEK
ncbi:hypothetical protein BJ875DRAFT_27997 [Amylocarpus encephaloides]|uniref:Uncharacterized protein n=1 Tax=Amylocarpus encephaloides TaxID=45428 RepID=A0A9P7YJ36_9HELO|nr:hypothetical protein BJ875DRAFT_27997 [Amylocarpus encephaloides]